MSFFTHGEMYRLMSVPRSVPGRPLEDRPRPHRFDEFPAGYSLVGCAPAEPASASPAGTHLAQERLRWTIQFRRTANNVLTVCRSPGDNPTKAIRKRFF